MKVAVLRGYQWLTGLSDTGTGVMLCVAPLFTLRLMGVQAEAVNAPYVSYIGAFVLALGLSCLYGAFVIGGHSGCERLEVVWVVTALSRAAVAIYVAKAVLTGTLQTAWLTVAVFDGACALIQFVGLKRKWIANAE